MPDSQFLYQVSPYTLQVVKTPAITLLVIKTSLPEALTIYILETRTENRGTETVMEEV